MASARPLGVTIFGSLNRLFFGALGLLMWLAAFVVTMNPEGRQELLDRTPGLSPSMVDVFIVGALIVSALTMVTGHWALKGQERGRVGTLVVAVLGLVSGVVGSLNQPITISTVLGALYNVAMLWYFTRPDVKAWFGHSVVRPL